MNSYYKVSAARLLATAIVFFATSSSWAQTASLESQLLSCSTRTTDDMRLACYDRLADTVRQPAPVVNTASSTVNAADSETDSGPGAEPSSAVTEVANTKVGSTETVESVQSANTKSQTFDTDAVKKQSIRIMIEKTKRNARGDWYFYFDNGEVWKQIDTRPRRIPSLPIAATVSRGIFSSHKLHIDGQVWSMKIRRVK